MTRRNWSHSEDPDVKHQRADKATDGNNVELPSASLPEPVKTGMSMKHEAMTAKQTAEAERSIGIIRALGELAGDTVLDEVALAKLFGRHRVSVKRAVTRGELPPPVRMFGCPAWTVHALREHMTERLEKAKQEADQIQRRVARLSP